MYCCRSVAPFLAVFAIAVTLIPPSAAAGALSRNDLKRAAEAAGFQVRSIKFDLPVALGSRYPFVSFEYDDALLSELRETYHLQKLIAEAPDEWTAQRMLKDWVFHRIPGGDPRSSPENAVEILSRAAQGEQFYCTYYAITYVECAHALGWQARKIGVDRKHAGGRLLGSSHHGVAEVWSNQFCKWVLVDAQSNLHFEKEGIPLNAYELRAEWLRSQGKDVKHIVGAPPHSVEKNPAMVWSVPDSDEIATYYWLYVQDSASVSWADSKFILLEDEHNDGEIWYQNDQTLGHSQFHNAFLNNKFEPTDRIEDLYWTVGIVEAEVGEVVQGAIHFRLHSYCPNLADYEWTSNGAVWHKTDERVIWSLKSGWNTLGLRTVNRAGVTGTETAFIVLLEPRSLCRGKE